MMMKTPEEIKRGLECCSDCDCTGCAYDDVMSCSEQLMEDAHALIRQLEAKVPRWIPVEERLPEDKKAVIVVFKDGWRTMAWRYHGEWYTRQHITETGVTHWMPLPEPPEEVVDNDESNPDH